ncbi:unnamed protein product [Microthlaspi erraticum]|uniref:Uncharacterized protein n=1 Tax=Microthlaspi erraticum TaxID=1685480 RepID=A0A6D2KAS1_9BRAS|nr:unnamed protein product [Microthlaspi erraticum]
MIIRANGEIESEEDPEPEKPKDEEEPEEYEAVPVQGKLLVARRVLSTQVKTDKDEQRENLFHTRCLVKIRRVIHDGFTNRYTLLHEGRKTTLIPLSPQEVYEDQLQLAGKEVKSPKSPKPKNFLVKPKQIDFVPGSTLPNRPAYRTNPVETKELQRQVDELMEKGHIRESMSPCAVPCSSCS